MYALPNTVQPCASPISRKSYRLNSVIESVARCSNVVDLLDDRKSHFTNICQWVSR
jgi:hypothetical protein